MLLKEFTHTAYTEPFQCSTDAEARSIANKLFADCMEIQLSSSTEQQKKVRYYRLFKKFREDYTALNRSYRRFFCHVDPSDTRVNLFAKTYNKHQLEELIKSELKILPYKAENHRVKYPYSKELVFYILQIELALLFAIQRDNLIHLFQVGTALCRILTEYFEPEAVKWNEVLEMFGKYMNTIEFEDISPVIEMISDDAAFARRERLSGIQYDSKSKKIAPEEIIQLKSQGMTQTQIKQYLSAKYDCSAATVQRVMRNSGLSRKYRSGSAEQQH